MKKIIIAILTIVLLFIMGFLIYKSVVISKDTIKLNKETVINSLVKYKLDKTKDFFEITKKVKWKIPDTPEDSTVSFDIMIPYTITTEDTTYEGNYILGDNSVNSIEEECKYDVKITNLDKDGNITVIIKRK